MAARLIALLACREISVDENNNVSLMGIVSSVTMPTFPRALEGYLFIRVAGLEGDHVVTLEIRDVDRGLTVGTSAWEVSDAVAQSSQDFTVTIDVDVTEPVTIEARILVDDEVIGWTDVAILGPQDES
jgi:hypothetical protein